MSTSSWFLSFLSGQLDEVKLQDPTVLETLTGIDFEADDREELWQKKAVQQAYTRTDGKPDRRLFDGEYDKTMRLFQDFEVGKTREGIVRRFEGGGTMDPIQRPPGMGSDGSRRFSTVNSRASGAPEVTSQNTVGLLQTYYNDKASPYIRGNVAQKGTWSNLEDFYTPEQISRHTNRVREDGRYDPETGKPAYHDYGWMDRWNTVVVMENEETGEYEMRERSDGMDVIGAEAAGNIKGTIGWLGPRAKREDAGGLPGDILDIGKYTAGSLYNLLIGTGGKGVLELASATAAVTVGNQEELEDLYSWFHAQAYRRPENIENGSLSSVKGFTAASMDAVAQVGGAILMGYGLTRAGMSPAMAGKTVAGALTLYGANEIFHQARTYGLDDKYAAAIYGGSLLALYGTNKLTPYLMKPLMRNEAREMAGKVIGEALDPASIQKLQSGVLGTDKVVKSIWNGFARQAGKLKGSQVLRNAGEEAAQEMLEEGAIAAGEAGAYYMALFAKDLGLDNTALTEHGQRMFDENMNLTALGKRFLQSGVFGGIGGAAGGAVHHLFQGKDNKTVPDMLTFLSQYRQGKGDPDFNQNYETMRAELDAQHAAGALASTKIGFNKLTHKTEAITPKNREHMVSLNDFFYRTQLQTMEAARAAWENTGLNDLRADWDKYQQGVDFDKSFKLTALQKSFAQKLLQKEANNTLLNLYRLDQEILKLKEERGATDSEADAALFKAKMYGTGKKTEGGEAPKKKAKAAKGKKGKGAKADKSKTGKAKTDKSKTDKSKAGKAEKVTPPAGFGTYANEPTILAEQGLMGLREHYLEQIEGLRNGQRMDEIYRKALLHTDVTPVRGTDGKPLRYEMNLEGLKLGTAYHKAEEQLDNLNLSIQYARQAEEARIAAANEQLAANYAEGLQRVEAFDWSQTLPVVADLDEDNPALYRELEEQVTGMVSFGFNDADRAAVSARVAGFFDRNIAGLQAAYDAFRADRAEDLAAGEEGAVNDEQSYLAILGALAEQRTRHLQRIEAAVAPDPQVLDDRNNQLNGFYLKTLREVDYQHKGPGGKKETRFNVISGDGFLADDLAEQEALLAQLRDEYTDEAAATLLLRDINARLSQVRLNMGANRKANDFRTRVLEALVDEQDPPLSDVDRILKAKRALQQAQELAVPGLDKGLSKGEDFTALGQAEGKVLEGTLLGMRQRAQELLRAAQNNAPNYDRVRQREDVRHLFFKARSIRAMVNREDPAEGVLLPDAPDDWKKAVLAHLDVIETQSEKMFEEGRVPDKPEGKLLLTVTEKQLQALIEAMLQVDHAVHALLNDQPDPDAFLATQAPADPSQMGARGSDYVLLKAARHLNPHDFLAAYAGVMSEALAKRGTYLASYIQQEGVRIATSLLVAGPGDYSQPDAPVETLLDMVFATGVQGSGKTTQVGRLAVATWDRITSDAARISPEAMDGTVADFISAGTGTVVEPFLIDGEAVYAEYDGKKTIPVFRFVGDMTKAQIQGWAPGYAKVTIKDVKHPTKSLDSVPAGSYAYVSSSATGKTIYLLGSAPPFKPGSSRVGVAPKLQLVRTARGNSRVLAVSRYKKQADKLQKLVGSLATTLPPEAGDEQVKALVALLESSVATRTPLEHELILFDEATLITAEELQGLNAALYAYNAQGLWKKATALHAKPLRVLLLGDVQQVGAPGGLRGKVTGSTAPNPATGGTDYWESEEHSWVVDRTPEMAFSFRSGVKDIFELVRVFREGRFNTLALGSGEFLGFKSRYYLGKDGARGVQIVSPQGREAAIRELLKTLGEERRAKVAYILPDLPVGRLTSLKERLAGTYDLPLTQFYSVSEAQGLDFDYTINDYEYEGATFEAVDSITEHGLRQTAVSGIGRSKHFALFVTSDDPREMRSERVDKSRSVESHREVEPATAEQKTAYLAFLDDLAKRYATSRSAPAAPPVPPAPVPTATGFDDKTLDLPWLNATLAKHGVTVSQPDPADPEALVASLRTTAGREAVAVPLRWAGLNSSFASLFRAERAEDTKDTGVTGFKFNMQVDGHPLPGDPNLDTSFRLPLGPDPMLWPVETAPGEWQLQEIERVVQVGMTAYLVPVDSAHDPSIPVATIPQEPARWPDLKDARVLPHFYEKARVLVLAVYDGPGKPPKQVVLSSGGGGFRLSGAADVALSGGRFTQADIDQASYIPSTKCNPTI